MEILVGSHNEKETMQLQKFLTRFEVISLTTHIAETAIILRKTYSIKLPDAIIWATAQANNLILVSRNTRDFSEKDPSVRIPYKL